MSKRDQIFDALYVVLQPAMEGLTRNKPLVDFDAASFTTLSDDADPELTETFLNPPLYEFTMRPVLVLAVKGDDGAARDAALTALIDSAAAQLATVTDLGGLITDIRPQPVSYASSQIWGAAGIKGGELPIELDFWSTSSLG